MTATQPTGQPAQLDLLSLLGDAPTDPSGTSTFARYTWQAKQAVRFWLSCLERPDIRAVVCERVEDLVLVGTRTLTFYQLKTKNRGSWTARNVCDPGNGIDSLVESYLAMESLGLRAVSNFVLLLEGPPGEGKETFAFFGNPRSAGTELKRKIRGYGISAAKTDSFLSSLTIQPHQPFRSHIDAVVIRTIGGTWPSLTFPECEHLYDTLLNVATSAQAAELPPWSIRSQLGQLANGTDLDHMEDHYAHQVLTKEALLRLTPPLPAEDVSGMLARFARAGNASALEAKLRRAGGEAKIQEAQLLRAEADTRALEYTAASREAEERLGRLADKLLSHVGALANKIAREATTNPASYSRPGTVIFDHLKANPANLLALDNRDVFDREPDQLLGFLCSLSDRCLFPWKHE